MVKNECKEVQNSAAGKQSEIMNTAFQCIHLRKGY